MMTKAEMQDMVDGFAEMFRTYLLTLENRPDEWQTEYAPGPRTAAQAVFEAFTTWLWKDYFNVGGRHGGA